MGGIKKKIRKYSKPKKKFDKSRIEQENELVRKYGLKNKKEIWKAKSQISKIRRIAKNLIPKSDEEKQELFKKLNKMGFKVVGISDVLALTEEDWLGRRLQTFIVKKGLVTTLKQARQLIVHKHVLVDGQAINAPSFIVTTDLEKKITLKVTKVKVKKVKEEEKSEETQDGN